MAKYQLTVNPIRTLFWFSERPNECLLASIVPIIAEMFHLDSISELFPDTPIKLLRDVFEELQLYDLVGFLAKVKPRTLLLSVPPKEIRESLNASERATKFYHKAKVLIIEYIDEQSAVETCFKNIGSFFEALHPESQITGVTVKVFRTTDKRYRQFEVSKGKGRSNFFFF